MHSVRLFLASYRFGGHADRFVDLVGRPGRIAVIASAGDSWPESARASSVTSELGPLRSAGFDPHEVDLRDLVGRPERTLEVLSSFPAVWVRGGNTFVLRAQLARSGADVALSQLLADDALVYGGYSAGACVMGPTLRGIDFADPPEEVRPATGIDIVWDGLGLIEPVPVPHYESEMLDADDTGARMVGYYRERGIEYRTLTDEQVYVVDGDVRSVF